MNYRKKIKEEALLISLLILLFILSLMSPYQIKEYPYFVHWKTIAILAGLLLISTGLKESGLLHMFSEKILSHMNTERKLAFFLILLTAFFSSFLTNDVALFVVVPLTLGMQNLLNRDVSKLIIFEAISANVGSSLTPIGNPQNIFIWQKWGISFLSFIIKLFPLTSILLLLLFMFTFISFKNTKLEKQRKQAHIEKFLAISSFLFLITYLIFLQIDYIFYLLPIFFLFYLILFPSVIKNTDWLLLFLFILIFVDFQCVSNLWLIKQIMQKISINHFLLSAFLSQFMSNVPATIFISNFSNDWLKIAYGVNVGGNGFIFASLANIIALRLSNKQIFIEFHKYSIPFFIISLSIVYLILIC